VPELPNVKNLNNSGLDLLVRSISWTIVQMWIKAPTLAQL